MREGVAIKPPGGTGKRARGRFLHEVVTELQKVKWPDRDDVVQLTGVVIATCLLVGAYVAALDGVLGWLFQAIGMYGAK